MAQSPNPRTVKPIDLDQLAAELGSRDRAQELKEAVCDALLERTRRVVSGEGGFGAVVYGDLPSKLLASGFLLPRLNADYDEEASDIQIPAHGLDCRIAGSATGDIRLRPRFNVYVRALPTTVELFETHRELRPKARVNKQTADLIRQRLRQRMAEHQHQGEVGAEAGGSADPEKRATARRERSKRLRDAMATAYKEFGIEIPADKVPMEETEDGETVREEFADADLRIPPALSVRYEIPEKYVRLAVDAPELTLPLPIDPAEWTTRIETYNQKLDAAIEATYLAWATSPDGLDLAWRPKQAQSDAFWSQENWERFLQEVRREAPDPNRLSPRLQVKLIADPLEDATEAGLFTTRFAIENFRKTADKNRQKNDRPENGLFQVSLEVDIPSAALRWMSMERVKRSYHLSGFLQIPAIGVNGGVVDRAEDGLHRLKTTWAPRYVLPRMQPTDIQGVPVKFDELAKDDAIFVQGLYLLPKAMEDWVDEVEKELKGPLFERGEEGSALDEARQRERALGDVAAWRKEAARVRKGIEVLDRARKACAERPRSRAAAPFRAWLLMNRAFRGTNPSWRLFQLAFILAHIPTLASRVPGYEDFFDVQFDEATASLLYMTTGGGKSEAFFGVLIYALFLDRLRGKERGITAMVRYPLRLLTLQQSQRLARLLARAEYVRHAEQIGGAPFEIGFWVGSGNTPNAMTKGDTNSLTEVAKDIPEWSHRLHRDEEAMRAANPGYAQAADAWNKLPECPFCAKSENRQPTVLRRFPEQRHRLGIVCLNDVDCSWNTRFARQDRPEPLPFLLVDMDIYRRAPAVLLGTVDKLALIGNHPVTINRIAGMFGLGRWLDPANGQLLMPYDKDALAQPPKTVRPIAPAYRSGDEVFFDPLPSLIVQDELHLLEESLGTFDGIFETSLFALFEEFAKLLGDRACRVPGAPDQPRMPHVVGATATATDVARQMAGIYQKDVVQFPHPGPKLYRSFYTRLAEFEDDAKAARTGGAQTPREREAAAPWARVYVTLLTNGRPHTATSIAVLSAYAAGITKVIRDLTASDPARQQRGADELLGNLSDNPLQPRLHAALEACVATGRFDVLANLVDLHRIQLTYVTNKKGGDQLLSAMQREAPKDHAALGADYAIGTYDLELISGGVDIRTIQEVIQKAERQFDIGAQDIEETLRGIVATSAISHGVDVDKFNAMAFAGMPTDIAEYIQASSRVGRKHVGFSMLIPTPQNRRDRFIVEVHEPFHRFLERMIAPPAIERWADKAIKRTIPSLFQTFIAGVLYQKEFVEEPDDNKDDVRFPGGVRPLLDLFSGPHADQVVQECIDFIVSAIGVHGARGGAPDKGHYENLVRCEVQKIRSEIASGKFGSDLTAFWESPYHDLHHPMTSLRDVDEAGEIHAAPHVVRGYVNSDKLARAMLLIRNRKVVGRRSSAGGETTTEGKDKGED